MSGQAENDCGPTDTRSRFALRRRFEWMELRTPSGSPAGVYAWCQVIPACDHEHDQDDPTCEDARIEMSRP